jgi:hypothetical protein
VKVWRKTIYIETYADSQEEARQITYEISARMYEDERCHDVDLDGPLEELDGDA